MLMYEQKEKLPVCCRQEMSVSLEMGRFLELKCGKCMDVIYVKKYGTARNDFLSQALK